MYYELALISVLVAGAYWGWFFVRSEAMRLYGTLQLVAAALSGLGLYGAKLDKPGLGIVGAVGVGAGVCLLIVGPLARAVGRRFAAGERFTAAQRMFDIAEVLAPGSGVDDEKALLGAMREIRDGNIEQAVEALTAAKHRAPDEARLAIDERIAMLYLAAYRWDEAIAHAEAHLFAAVPPREAGPSLRHALGIGPPVWVELLGAYGYTGDLDQAARMLARLEDACADRPDASIWIHRARLMFLALAGRVGAVQALVQRRRSPHMKPAARTYWVAVAHERHGEVAAAEAAYTKARAGSRGRPRALIEQAIARLPQARPVELGTTAHEVIARVEAAPPPTIEPRPRARGPIAPRIFIAAIAAVSIVVTLVFGSTSDYGVLMRAGALVRGLVADGEWWRLVSCIFVHVGFVHAAVNAIGLWLLGRLCEDLFGPWRASAVFAVAGIAGGVASFLAMPAGMSAGASGAVFGFAGAVFVELTLHRRRHRAAPVSQISVRPPGRTDWRGVWGTLAIVIVAQFAFDLLYPVSDQWAHGVGLATGAVLGVVLSPRARWTLLASRVIVAGFVAVACFAGVMVARTTLADSLSRAPQVRRQTALLSAMVPSSWLAEDDELYHPDHFLMLVGAQPQPLDELTKAEEARAKSLGFDQVTVATDRLIPLPPGWQASELVVSQPDPLDTRQQFRVVVATRGDAAASMYMPQTLAREAPAFFTRMLASVQSLPPHARP